MPPAEPERSDQAAYDELQCYTLGRGDPDFIHQHIVDAWIAQHADEHTKAIAVTFALVGLFLHLEKGFSGRRVQRAHMAIAQRKHAWPPVILPPQRGAVSVHEVLAAPPGQQRDEAIDAWCASVWEAYSGNREALVTFLQQAGILPPG